MILCGMQFWKKYFLTFFGMKINFKQESRQTNHFRSFIFFYEIYGIKINFKQVSRQTNHLHHFRVVEVVDDMFENVSVRDETERTEDDDDGNLLPNVRQDSDDPLADRALPRSLQRTRITKII